MKKLLLLGALALLSLIGGSRWLDNARLRAEIAALRGENAELVAAREENARLRQLAVDATARAERGRMSAASGQGRAPAAHGASQPAMTPGFTVGEWRSTGTWQNRGDATPIAALETILWAGAGGDVSTVQRLLELDAEARVKADALHARLPDVSRAMYPTAEQLIATLAAKAIPLGDAQVVWNHQPTADEAVACVFTKNNEPQVLGNPAAFAGPGDTPPPMGRPNTATRITYLVLRRGEAGWRFIVTIGIIDKIAKELR